MRHTACVLLLCAVAGSAGAAPARLPFSFESTPGELPKTVVPKHYALRFEPDLEKLKFSGNETVDIQVLKPTRTIVLNALELEVTRATLQVSNVEIALRPIIDGRKQTLELELPKTLVPGECRLRLEFNGRLSQQAQGLFYARYRAGGEQKIMLCTQMEPADARRMFPCWDEPVFRATFDLSVVVPEKHLALSNMPIKSEAPLGNGRKEVVFEQTPPMASYLVALVSGELEALSAESRGVKLRVLTTGGKKEEGRYALEAAQKLLAYYVDYFEINYPLPKLDLIAVPGGFSGAMENWGAITYEESELLFDPANSSQGTKQEVFVTVAHEMAHQWFGNLVTPAWWDDLWLNEGFATWMETKATDHFNPGWQMWLAADAEKNAVMSRDARRTTHPIQQQVLTESAANDAFDSITYEKGAAFIHMLESYLGDENFRSGIHAYLEAHRYSNTTTVDLWDALGRAAGKPLQSLCTGWTEQPGLPVVKVSVAGKAGAEKLRLEQERFTVQDPKARKLLWEIPVALRDLWGGPSASNRTVLLTAASALVAWPLPPDTSVEPALAVKANARNTGYYRVWYEPGLFQQLLRHYAQLPDADRLNLVDDSWAMVEGGRASATNYFDLLKTVGREQTGAVGQQVISTLELIDELQRDRPERAAFRSYACSVLRPQLEHLGWTNKPGELGAEAVLRTAVIGALGLFKDAEVVARARAEFEKALTAPQSVSADLRPAIFRIVGRYGDRQTYDQIHELARQARGTEDRQLYYRAMAGSADTELARSTLELSLTDELVPQEASALVPEVAHSGQHPELAWEFFTQHAHALMSKVDSFDRDNYAPSIADAFTEASKAEELIDWVRQHLPAEARVKAEEAAEEIRFRAWLKQRELPAIKRWLEGKTEAAR